MHGLSAMGLNKPGTGRFSTYYGSNYVEQAGRLAPALNLATR
jgi:hypothetical protein